MPFKDIIAYDNKCFVIPNCAERGTFLQKWVAVPGGSSYAALDSAGHVVGMGFRQPCFQDNNYIVGPLYADSPHIAETLLHKLCAEVAGSNITINIWLVKPN